MIARIGRVARQKSQDGVASPDDGERTLMATVLAIALLAHVSSAAASAGNRIEIQQFKQADDLVAARLPVCLPGATVTRRQLDASGIEEYVSRGKAELKKDFVLSPVERIALLGVTLSRDPGRADNADPVSLGVEILAYSTPARALENYEYMRKSPHWIERGHGQVARFADRYGYRVTSLGSDQALSTTARCVENALVMFARQSGAPATPSSPWLAQGVAESPGTGGAIVYARNGDSLVVPVPPGWNLDTKTLRRAGINVLFYPEGGRWGGEQTPVFAYVMPTVKGDASVSVAGLIKLRTQQLGEVDPAATSRVEREPRADKGESVTIARYESTRIPRYERIAYIEDERVIFAVILSAASSQLLEQSSSLIDAIVGQHRRLTSAHR